MFEFLIISTHMKIFILILNIVETIIYVYFLIAAVYVLSFSVFALFYKSKKYKMATKYRKIAVLIPGYKEDKVIIDVARQALSQNYPDDKFDVIIIADSFHHQTIEALKLLPIKLIEVSFDVSTKSKALNKAMEQLPDNYDVALILDADNVMELDFLTKINNSFESGFKVVQGHRVAKNTNTAFAVLDAVSEELNNTIFRKGHRAIGLSSALIGSGMAFDYLMFKARMLEVKAVGGFDKELELTLLRDKVKIEYLNDAIVADEKVQKVEVFENQRRRWLSAQFIYFRRFVVPGFYHLITRANIDFFDKVYQMISPPRILLLGVSFLITAFYFALSFNLNAQTVLMFNYYYWFTLLLLIVAAFGLAIPPKFYNKQTFFALLSLPKAFISMFVSLFKLKGANKKFIHTQHGTD